MVDHSNPDDLAAHRMTGRTTVRRLVGLSFIALVLMGCQSARFAGYVSPRITGRVLDQKTHQPLAGVTVVRLTGGQTQTPPDQLKGAQALKRPVSIRTDEDGRFVLNSEKIVALFQHPSWYSVTVSFKRAGYDSWQTNYTIGNVSGHASNGAPVVDAGSIFLQRSSQDGSATSN